MKSKNIHHYSRFTDKSPSIAERVIRTIHNLIKKPVFERRNADWLSKLSVVFNQYNKTIHHLIKMTPNQASRKSNERKVYTSLQDPRLRQKPK